MTTLLHPTTELVAQAWLATIPGIAAGMVATQLPDNSSIAASGFVTVAGVGGTPATDVPMGQPVLSIDTWATNSGIPGRTTSKVPWGKAAALAQLVFLATFNPALGQQSLAMPVAGFASARVLSPRALTEPRRAYGDQGQYAHYVMNVLIPWVE